MRTESLTPTTIALHADREFEANDGIAPAIEQSVMWTLAETWYSTRLQVDSRRPQPEEMREIFSGLGLRDDFWDPRADRFGTP